MVIFVKLKDIRLVTIKLYQNNELIYEGKIEQLDSNYLDYEAKKIDFENRTMIITI